MVNGKKSQNIMELIEASNESSEIRCFEEVLIRTNICYLNFPSNIMLTDSSNEPIE